MTTIAINAMKSMVRKVHGLRFVKIPHGFRNIYDAVEFIVLMTLPMAIPFGIMYLTSLNNYF